MVRVEGNAVAADEGRAAYQSNNTRTLHRKLRARRTVSNTARWSCCLLAMPQYLYGQVQSQANH